MEISDKLAQTFPDMAAQANIFLTKRFSLDCKR
jgi:hypothetical protein